MRPPVIRLNDPSQPVSRGPGPAKSDPVTKVRPSLSLVLASPQPALLDQMDVSGSDPIKTVTKLVNIRFYILEMAP